MTLVHLRGNPSCQTVNVVGRHCVIDVDVQRADLHVRAVVIQYQVEHAVYALEVQDLLLNLFGEVCRNARAQQFIDGRGQHLDTSLDDDKGNQSAQDTVERYTPQQHDTRRDKRSQRNDGIEQCIRAGGNQRVALQLFALLLDILAKDKFHHNSHDDDHQCSRGVRRLRGVEYLLH